MKITVELNNTKVTIDEGAALTNIEDLTTLKCK